MTTLKLISVKDLNGEITALLNRKLEVTLSLAYYSMINGNAAPLKGFNKDITSELDSKTKQFICAKFDAKKNEWAYSKEKATKLLKRLSVAAGAEIKFQDCTWEQFLDAVNKDLATPAVELTEEELRIQNYKQGKAGIAKSLEKLVAAGLTAAQMQAIIADALLATSITAQPESVAA